MVRFATGLGLASALCAALVVWLPNPWAVAEAQAEQDVAAIAGFIDEPDKISWHLTEAVPLLRALVWDADGDRRYPPRTGMVPPPYQLSAGVINELTSIQADTESAVFASFDVARTQLLYCRAAPAVCLVYDRVLLEEVLRLPGGALASDGTIRGVLLALSLAVCALSFGFVGLRRRSGAAAPGFRIDPERHMALRDTLEVSLTPRDVKLLLLLEQRAGAVVTKDELYDEGWGRDYMPNSRALDQHMINLRKKLDPDKSWPVLIETVHGVGYRLVL